MTVTAVSMVKDEADIIEATVRHMAGQVDRVIVADNMSTDGTRQILDKLAVELPTLTVVDDNEPAYYQSAKMTALAVRAAQDGATWIVPFDADEIWHVSVGGGALSIADTLVGQPAEVTIADAFLFNHLRTALDVPHDDPVVSMVWRQQEQARLRKVAFRYTDGAVIHQGNHDVHLPNGGIRSACLEVRHFPVRSAEQFIRKALNGAQAYSLTDLPQSQGEHWRGYGRLYDHYGEEGLKAVYHDHWWYMSPSDAGLVRDPAPYHPWRTR